jgi:hypothetical protein
VPRRRVGDSLEVSDTCCTVNATDNVVERDLLIVTTNYIQHVMHNRLWNFYLKFDSVALGLMDYVCRQKFVRIIFNGTRDNENDVALDPNPG